MSRDGPPPGQGQPRRLAAGLGRVFCSPVPTQTPQVIALATTEGTTSESFDIAAEGARGVGLKLSVAVVLKSLYYRSRYSREGARRPRLRPSRSLLTSAAICGGTVI
jgi:hypothetical protein